MYLRENSHGNETVHDVGNMIGHGDSRTKGISIKRVIDLYEVSQFAAPAIEAHPNGKHDILDAPERILEAMAATYRLLDDDVLLRETGLNRAQASTLLTKISRKFVRKPNGRMAWNFPTIHAKEFSLIQCLTCFIVSKPAYTGNDFFEEMQTLLLKHGFMDEEQTDLLLSRRPHLILFAMTAIHGVRYIMPNGDTVIAEAGWISDRGEAILQVSATIRIPWRKIGLAFPIFDTGLPAAAWAEEYSPSRKNIAWSVPLEVSPSGKLRAIE